MSAKAGGDYGERPVNYGNSTQIQSDHKTKLDSAKDLVSTAFNRVNTHIKPTQESQVSTISQVGSGIMKQVAETKDELKT